jgi:PelA/Pel-15E family pectate lyase
MIQLKISKIVKSLSVLALILLPALSFAQSYKIIEKEPFADDTHHWYGIFDKHNVINPLPGKPQYQPTEITKIADNILLFQKNNGGWPKNYDMFAILTPAQTDSVFASKSETNTTFDNGTTYTHIAALATAFQATKVVKYKTAAIKGLNFILKAQYPNGGWPQYYPIEKNNYSSHITFNDGAMIGIMQLLKDINDGKPLYDFINKYLRNKILSSYQKGLDCILKTQINDDGQPTAWCQQYDEFTLKAAWARKFEPAAICNKEGAEIVLFLMSIKHPSPQIIKSVEDAVKWFQVSAIKNTRFETVKAPHVITAYRVSDNDRIAVTDSTAPLIWTRFYELKTHRPIFCDRDSKIVYSLDEISRERRAGYGWYVYTPTQVLNHYPAWKAKWVK